MRRAAALVLFLIAFGARAEDPDILWKLVDGKCVPAAQAHLPPAPCTAVDATRGMAVLKDRAGAYQYLVIPTTRITGIEDPAVLADNASFAVAWDTRRLVIAKLGTALPDPAFSVAVNSQNGRSQNQLHLHVDCLEAGTRGRLMGEAIGESWAPFRWPLGGHRYIARLIAADSLDGINPFRLLAEHVGGPIGDWTLVLTRSADKPAFILLASNDGRASGEDLQDHACRGY